MTGSKKELIRIIFINVNGARQDKLTIIILFKRMFHCI